MRTPPPPIPIEPCDRNTFAFSKRVLLIVRSDSVLSRLDTLCQAIFSDTSIQCVFTVPEPISPLDRGIDYAIAKLGGIVLPWSTALNLEFDLAIAVSPNGEIEKVRAPLIVMQHGPGLIKEAARIDTLDMIQRLRTRENYPSYILEPTDPREIGGPYSNINIKVVGDPVYDSMLASINQRPFFRSALHCAGRKLVVISSTWGPDSLLCHYPNIISALISELPANDYRFALILHPYAWAAHGSWQIETWFKKEIDSGLSIIPHQQGWEATLLAANCLIGDHGSVTCYADALGLPTLVSGKSSVAQNKDAELNIALSEQARIMSRYSDAIDFCTSCKQLPDDHSVSSSSAIHNIGKAYSSIREICYEILGLPAPKSPIQAPSVMPHSILIDCIRLYRSSTSATSENNLLQIRTFPACLPSDSIEYDGPLISLAPSPQGPFFQLADTLVCTQPLQDEHDANRALDSMLTLNVQADTALCPSSKGWMFATRESNTAHLVNTDINDPATIAAAIRWLDASQMTTSSVQVGRNVFTIAIS